MMRSTTIIAPLPLKEGTGVSRPARRAAGIVSNGGIAILFIALGASYLFVSAILACARFCINGVRGILGR